MITATWKSLTIGPAPISPDEPFDEAAYEAMIDAMDALISLAEGQGAEATGDGLERGRS